MLLRPRSASRYTALPIIAALWEHLPIQPDKLGNARHLLRKFLWRAFLTSRYEQSSTSNALQDYRGLRKVLCAGATEDVVPILNAESYPLPTKELVLQADWPKRKTILGRGLLSLQIKCGAEDLADGARATLTAITSKEHPREYHHLFPVATLEDAGIPYEQIFKALNCALVTWRTKEVVSYHCVSTPRVSLFRKSLHIAALRNNHSAVSTVNPTFSSTL